MGNCIPTRDRSSSTFNTIRLVHLDGFVEDFDYPVSVSEVIGKKSKQFLCTAAQLAAGSKPLNPDAQLQPGNIYFVLPLSTLQDDMSPLDMAAVAKRLMTRAKSIRSSDAASPKYSPSSSRKGSGFMVNSSDRSPGRAERREMTYGLPNSYRERGESWKPILDTIRELSFTRRSESDLREMQFILKK